MYIYIYQKISQAATFNCWGGTCLLNYGQSLWMNTRMVCGAFFSSLHPFLSSFKLHYSISIIDFSHKIVHHPFAIDTYSMSTLNYWKVSDIKPYLEVS